MALMPRPFAGGLTGGLTDDFFSPFFGGFPDITRDLTRALQPLTAGGESMALATRGMPVDVVSGAGVLGCCEVPGGLAVTRRLGLMSGGAAGR
jgi:hypothetical protein